MSTTENVAPDVERPRSLRRSRSNRWLAGVSGGLAEYFGLSAAVYRVLFVALAFAGGTGIVLYVAAALVMPAEDREESTLVETLRRNRDRPWLVIGMALVALCLIFSLSGPEPDGPDFLFWPIALVVLFGGAIFLAVRNTRGGRRVVAITGVLAVALLLAATGVLVAAHEHGGIGERVERPLAVGDLRPEYRLGFGDLELDLRNLTLPLGETRILASVGVGELTVILPADVPATATATAEWGELSVLGAHGESREIRVVDPGFETAETRLVIDARADGPAEVTIRR